MCYIYSMCSNFAAGARLLLDHGADINSKDGRQNTATMAAGALGHYEVLEVLLEHHLLNIHAGVRYYVSQDARHVAHSLVDEKNLNYTWFIIRTRTHTTVATVY